MGGLKFRHEFRWYVEAGAGERANNPEICGDQTNEKNGAMTPDGGMQSRYEEPS